MGEGVEALTPLSLGDRIQSAPEAPVDSVASVPYQHVAGLHDVRSNGRAAITRIRRHVTDRVATSGTNLARTGHEKGLRPTFPLIRGHFLLVGDTGIEPDS